MSHVSKNFLTGVSEEERFLNTYDEHGVDVLDHALGSVADGFELVSSAFNTALLT